MVLLVAAVVAATIVLAPSATAASGGPKPRLRPLLGVVPDRSSGRYAARGVAPEARAATAANLPYQGGPVLHSNRTHLIFWQPSGSGLSFDPGYVALFERFMTHVALASHDPSNVYGLTGQYVDAAGPAVYRSTYGGAVIDDDPLPADQCVEPPIGGPGWGDCVDDSQVQSEIERTIVADHLPVQASDVYFLVTPNGLGVCETTGPENCALGGSAPGAFCGYHSTTPDGEILYAIIPYNAVPGHCQSDNPRPNASSADPALSTLSHEHSEMVTDPFGSAYVDSSGNEDGDLCISDFGPPLGGAGGGAWNEVIAGGHYWLQEEWSNENEGCRPSADPATLSLSVRAVRGVARERWFSARGRAPHGSLVAFAWQFGDGSGGRGALVRHRYRRNGRYRVQLRATDSAGNYTYAASSVLLRGNGR